MFYDDIKIQDIRKSFPLEGEYYFRFRFNYNKNVVWLDINSEDCKYLIQFKYNLSLKLKGKIP